MEFILHSRHIRNLNIFQYIYNSHYKIMNNKMMIMIHKEIINNKMTDQFIMYN